MGLDIKMPIGLMFLILGLIITIFGLISAGDAEVYQKSMGINVNLWTGIFMLIFGGVMFAFSKKVKKDDLD